MKKSIINVIIFIAIISLTNCDLLDDLFNNANNQGNAPQVSFAQPTDGQIFIVGSSLGVVVEASTPEGSITSVDLYINNTFVRSENTSPYKWGTENSEGDNQLLNLSAGTYKLKAEAINT